MKYIKKTHIIALTVQSVLSWLLHLSNSKVRCSDWTKHLFDHISWFSQINIRNVQAECIPLLPVSSSPSHVSHAGSTLWNENTSSFQTFTVNKRVEAKCQISPCLSQRAQKASFERTYTHTNTHKWICKFCVGLRRSAKLPAAAPFWCLLCRLRPLFWHLERWIPRIYGDGFNVPFPSQHFTSKRKTSGLQHKVEDKQSCIQFIWRV